MKDGPNHIRYSIMLDSTETTDSRSKLLLLALALAATSIVAVVLIVLFVSKPSLLSKLLSSSTGERGAIKKHAWWTAPLSDKMLDTIVAEMVAGKADDVFNVEKNGTITKAPWMDPLTAIRAGEIRKPRMSKASPDSMADRFDRRNSWDSSADWLELKKHNCLNIFLDGRVFDKKLTPEEALAMLKKHLDSAEFRSK